MKFGKKKKFDEELKIDIEKVTGENFNDVDMDVFLRSSSHISYPYHVHLLAPNYVFKNSIVNLHCTVDSDLDAFFRTMKIQLDCESNVQRYDDYFSDDDFSSAKLLLEEYATRKYKKSIWKSYPEYKNAVEKLSDQVGIKNIDYVSKWIVDLIELGLDAWSFKVDFKEPNSEYYKDQVIYRPLKSYKEGNDDNKSDICRKWAWKLFCETDSYNLSYLYCQSKIYRSHYKNFDSLLIRYGDDVVGINKVLGSTHKKEVFAMPYIFFSSIKGVVNNDVKKVRETFESRLCEYLKERNEYEK